MAPFHRRSQPGLAITKVPCTCLFSSFLSGNEGGPQRMAHGSHLLRGRDADSKVPCYASKCGVCCNARLDVDVIASHVSPHISPHPIRPDWLRHATLNPARQIPSTDPSSHLALYNRDRCSFLLSDQGAFQAVATQRMSSAHGSFRWVCVKRREGRLREPESWATTR